MFSKSRKKKSNKNSTVSSLGRNSAPSVISADMNVFGSIVSDGFLDVDGKIDGNIKASSIVIRANGSVRGDVVADNVQIYGYVEGLVKASTVNLHSTAHVSGSIMHEALSVEDGAFVDGKFKRTDKVFIDAEDEKADADDEDSDVEAESVLDNIKLISS